MRLFLRYDVRMPAVTIQIERFVDDSFPGFVACNLIDAYGNKHLFLEKAPIVSKELLPDGRYPRPGCVACIVEHQWRDATGRQLARVNTAQPWGIESTSGQSLFDVLLTQILPDEAPT